MSMPATQYSQLDVPMTSNGHGCWIPAEAPDDRGYVRACVEGKKMLVHRIVYESLVGEIPSGLELDRCLNPSCCNPAHLEPVTHRENILRSGSQMAMNARKTHCVHGHELTGDNLYLTKKGHRSCRACMLRNSRAHRSRRRRVCGECGGPASKVSTGLCITCSRKRAAEYFRGSR